MKKIIIISIAIVCSYSTAFAQTDSLKDAILKYEDTISLAIKNGRKLLLDDFQKNDKVKTQLLFTYLTTKVENDDYIAVYPIENILINYWLGQYAVIDSNTLIYTPEYIKNNDRKLRPHNDLLYDKLRTYMTSNKEEQIKQIESAGLEEEDKSFLKINLIFFLSDFKRLSPMQDTLNTLTTDFFTKYPNSKYEPYIRDQIRWAFVPSKIGYGFDFFTGYGIFTKTLSNQFQNNIPLGVGFEMSYKKMVLYFRDYIGFSQTKQDINYPSATWTKGKQVRVYLPEFSVGYLCTISDKLKIIPFVGISSTDISPTTHDENNIQGYGDVGWKFTTTYTFGLNVDISLSKLKITEYKMNYMEKGCWLLKLRYAYNIPQFQNKYAGLEGAMHYLTVGIGMLGRRYKRD